MSSWERLHDRQSWILQSKPIVAGHSGASGYPPRPKDNPGVLESTRALDRNLGSVATTTGRDRESDVAGAATEPIEKGSR